MARKASRRAHKRAVTHRSQRDVSVISRRERLLRLSEKRRKEIRRDRRIEDRRLFRPDRSLLLTSGGRIATREVHRPRVTVRARKNVLPHRIQFVDPRRTIVCRRRKRRREVLFAMKRTGKGARRRLRLFTAESQIVC